MEDNQTLKTVDLCRNALVYNHVAQLTLSSLEGYSYKLSKPLQSDASVVAFNHSYIVLDELLN